MQSTHEIDFIEVPGNQGTLGIITLQRPQALNALNHAMFLALRQQLKIWAADSAIKAVVIRAVAGRAFCAGGDIRSAYDKKMANDPTLVDFFSDEYQVNRQIFHFSKPYIALLDGITMGGGAGVSMHGSHRVATANMSFAMPETGIGYFPDVGASYFLSRLPSRIGFYLGLTGERISYADCFALGLVQAVIAAEAQDELIRELASSALPDALAVTNVIQAFSQTVPASSLMVHREVIAKCFSHETVETILAALEAEGSEWSLTTAKTLLTKSPTSLKITLQELLRGQQLDFDACMNMEEQLMRHFLVSHDFFEGIRAAVVDKDRMPRWVPADLSDVDDIILSPLPGLPPEGEGI